MPALIICNLASFACVAGAIYLLDSGIQDGWGWLLFLAIVLHATPSGSKNNDDESR